MYNTFNLSPSLSIFDSIYHHHHQPRYADSIRHFEQLVGVAQKMYGESLEVAGLLSYMGLAMAALADSLNTVGDATVAAKLTKSIPDEDEEVEDADDRGPSSESEKGKSALQVKPTGMRAKTTPNNPKSTTTITTTTTLGGTNVEKSSKEIQFERTNAASQSALEAVRNLDAEGPSILHQNAVRCHLRALAVRRRLLGPLHYSVADSAEAVGDGLERLGKFADALNMYEFSSLRLSFIFFELKADPYSLLSFFFFFSRTNPASCHKYTNNN
jgi:hypothetical protein